MLKSAFVFICLVFICWGREEHRSKQQALPSKITRAGNFHSGYHSSTDLRQTLSSKHLRASDSLATFAMLLSAIGTPATSRTLAASKSQALRGGTSKKSRAQADSGTSYEGSAMIERERSFIMIKPDGVQRALVGEIIKRFEQRGYQLKAMKLYRPSEDILREHYKEHVERDFFPGLLEYMLSGPVVCMVWEGDNVVKVGRQMLGATNPKDSLPGTIRGDFSIETQRNICHGSDSPESAEREIALWFSEDELCGWSAHSEPWIYK